MLTDEILNSMEEVYKKALESYAEYWHIEGALENVERGKPQDAGIIAAQCVKAAYPLIRAQVLDEVWEMAAYEATFMNNDGVDAVNRVLRKIRDMKEGV